MPYPCLACGATVREGFYPAQPEPDKALPACPACQIALESEGRDFLEGLLARLKTSRPRSGLISRLRVVLAMWDARLLPSPADLREIVAGLPNGPRGADLLWGALLRAAGASPGERILSLCAAGVDVFLAAFIASGRDPVLLPPSTVVVPKRRRWTKEALERYLSLPPDLAEAAVAGDLDVCRAVELAGSRAQETAAAARKRAEEEAAREAARLTVLERLLAEGNVPDPPAVAPRVLAGLKERTRREPDRRGSRGGEMQAARSALALLDLAARSGDPAGVEMVGFRQALAVFAGWKTLRPWFRLVGETGGRVITRRDAEREKAAAKRAALASVRQEEAQRKREQRAARERELVRALRLRLSEMGVGEPLLPEGLRRLARMLPEPYAGIVRLRHTYELFGLGCSREPAWVAEAPDPAALEEFRRAIPDDVLLEAWNDRWVTARTVADELGVSLERARQIMEEVGYIEVKNPHYSSAEPMKLSRLSAVSAWAASHPQEMERWTAASRRAREAYRRWFQREVEGLRSMPAAIARATDDPAPLVCFWLSLLNRAAKSGHAEFYRLKDEALRTLVRARVPFELGYVEGGDREERVWLCDACLEEARSMGMHPLDYIDIVGPCGNCDIEPAQARYYDLYALTFRFPGVGKFSYHVPYEIGRRYLPHPDALPEDALTVRGEEGAWAFGRALNKVEREAFTVEEIRQGLLQALEKLSARRLPAENAAS